MFITPQEKQDALNYINQNIVQNTQRSINGTKLHQAFINVVSNLMADPSLLIPDLELSFLTQFAPVLNDSARNAYDSAIMVRPKGSIAHLEAFHPEIWLFRKGKAQHRASGKPKYKFLHPSDPDSNRVGWSKYATASRGVRSDKLENLTYKGLDFTVKTEWEISPTLFEDKTALKIILDAEKYFGLYRINDANALSSYVSWDSKDFAGEILNVQGYACAAQFRKASIRTKKVRLTYDAQANKIRSGVDRGINNYHELAMALVIDHPTLNNTKVVGALTKTFLYRVNVEQEKTVFTFSFR